MHPDDLGEVIETIRNQARDTSIARADRVGSTFWSTVRFALESQVAETGERRYG